MIKSVSKIYYNKSKTYSNHRTNFFCANKPRGKKIAFQIKNYKSTPIKVTRTSTFFTIFVTEFDFQNKIKSFEYSLRRLEIFETIIQTQKNNLMAIILYQKYVEKNTNRTGE